MKENRLYIAFYVNPIYKMSTGVDDYRAVAKRYGYTFDGDDQLANINAGLTERQKETFKKFKDCTSELSCITEREAFSSGFILATRIMVEVMEGLQEVEDI